MPYSENASSSEEFTELAPFIQECHNLKDEVLRNQTTTTTETQGDEDPGDGVGNNPEQEQTSDTDQEYYEFTNLPKENTEFIKNLEQLEVNKDAPIYWGKVREEITTFDKIDNITYRGDTTNQNKDPKYIEDYLEIASTVPKENYPYIVENFKEIMRKYWAYHPQWMSQISKKAATGSKITIGMADMTNIYMEKNLNIIENLLKKSEDDQRKEIIKNLNNKVLVDFWLKTRLSSLKGEEEGKEKQGGTNQKEQKPSPRSLFIQKFLQEIPFDKLDTYFETAKDSVLLSDLRNSLIREQAKKEELFITKSEKESKNQKELAECGLLDLFDENKKAKCNKLAELSRKTNPKQEKNKDSEKGGEKEGEKEEDKKPKTFDEILDISHAIISNSQTVLKDPKTGVQYCDKQLLSSSEGWAALQDLMIFSEELPQKIKLIEDQEKYELNNNTQGVMSPMGDYHIGGIGVVNASALDIEKRNLMLNFEKKYTKVLLYSGEKPQGTITGKTGLTLDFTQGNNVEDIVINTTWEQIKLGRRNFKDDRKNDKQNAFGAIGGLIGGTMGTALTAAVTGGSNPWLLSAGYTIGSRLGNGYTQEYRNTGERILQLCGMDIKNNEAGVGVVDKNGVQEPLLPFLRGIGWLDQDYQPVGWGNFFIDLCGDYLAGAASFGLSNKIFGGELSGYLKNTTREIMQEFAIENLFIDTPMEILKAGTKSFFQTKGAENTPGVRNTMINTAEEVYSIENLSYTFFHTVTSCGFLGAVHKPLNYVTNNLTSPIIGNILNTKYTAIQQETKALAEQMKEKGLQLQNGTILQNGKEIDKNSKTFQDIQGAIQAIHTKYNEYIKLTQSTQIILQEKMKNLNDPDGIKLKYGLLSPFNTPMNILDNKINEAQTKLNEAQQVEDATKIKEYKDLLAEYEHAKEVLKGTYFNGEKHSEFGLETQDAINNSAAMDTICLAAEQVMLTDEERNNHIQTLLNNYIQTLLDNQRLPLEQMQSIEGITPLDNRKLNAIVEAHMQEGELGDLTPKQIRAKVTILEKAGFTSKQIRFLLEAGFCGREGGNSIRIREQKVRENIYNKELMQNFNTYLFIEGKKMFNIAYDNDFTVNNCTINRDNSNKITSIEISSKGVTITRESLELKTSQSLFDELSNINENSTNFITTLKEICKREGSYHWLNLFDLPHNLQTQEPLLQQKDFLNMMLDNKQDLSQEQKNQCFNEIAGRCLLFCYQEGIDINYLFTKFKPFLRDNKSVTTDTRNIPGAEILTSDLMSCDTRPNSTESITKLNNIFDINENNINQFLETITPTRENTKDDNMKFFIKTLFISSQIQWDSTIQYRGELSNIITDPNSIYQEFAKENNLELSGAPKSIASIIIKMLKDPKYAYTKDMNDIGRFTYTLSETEGATPEENIQNLLTTIGKFSRETFPEGSNQVFDCKFKQLLDKNEDGSFKYIKNVDFQTGEITTLGKDKEGKPYTFFINKKFFENKGPKTASGDLYADIKTILYHNGIPYEFKFILKGWKETNERGTSDHGVMRLIDHINKETRSKGFISEQKIQYHIKTFLKKYNTDDPDIKLKSKFFDELAQEFNIDKNETKAIEDKFREYIFSKYTKIGTRQGDDFYVSNNGYLDVAFKEYLKDQPIPEDWITEYKESLPQGHKDLKAPKEVLQYRARLYHRFTHREEGSTNNN